MVSKWTTTYSSVRDVSSTPETSSSAMATVGALCMISITFSCTCEYIGMKVLAVLTSFATPREMRISHCV